MQGLEPPVKTFQAGDKALIIGAGLAGSAVAGALARQGFQCRVFDSGLTAASQTSAIPVAIYRPQISLQQNVASRYYSRVFSRIVDEIKTLDNRPVRNNGLLQLITDQRSWQDGEHHRVLSTKEASDKANRSIPHRAIFIESAGSLVPSELCHHWLQKTKNIQLTTNTVVHQINRTSDGWELCDIDNNIICRGDFVVLANGLKANQLTRQPALPLTPISGQVSHVATPTPPAIDTPIIENKGYAVPTVNGYWVGATHHRHASNTVPSHNDDASNLATLKALANSTGTVTNSWTGVRCTTPDRLPVVGGVADSGFFTKEYRELHHGRKLQIFPPAQHIDGLYIIAGMGSRGATQALYAAELLVDIIKGEFNAESTIYAAVNPVRFLIRKLRQNPLNNIGTDK